MQESALSRRGKHFPPSTAIGLRSLFAITSVGKRLRTGGTINIYTCTSDSSKPKIRTNNSEPSSQCSRRQSSSSWERRGPLDRKAACHLHVNVGMLLLDVGLLVEIPCKARCPVLAFPSERLQVSASRRPLAGSKHCKELRRKLQVVQTPGSRPSFNVSGCPLASALCNLRSASSVC